MANKHGMPHVPEHMLLAQCARDAVGRHDDDYVIYLEHDSLTKFVNFTRAGKPELAEEMLTRNLGQALRGNDGE